MKVKLTKEQYCYSDLVDRLKIYHGDKEYVEWIEKQFENYLKGVQNESK
tara:strand:- start:1564 stop:1710 length:147 start_codon:yes stop_codon:yes gene_type:complete